MSDLRFRHAKQSDLPVIVEIYNSTVASRLATADTIEVSVESKQKWFEEHNADKRPLWIVEDETGEIIGWVSFSSFVGRPAYDATVEVSIYLATEKRRKGFGKKILQYCIDNAKNFGVKTLFGIIFAHNEPSLKLFYGFGFEDWGTLPNVAEIDRKEISVKILGKRIVA